MNVLLYVTFSIRERTANGVNGRRINNAERQFNIHTCDVCALFFFPAWKIDIGYYFVAFLVLYYLRVLALFTAGYFVIRAHSTNLHSVISHEKLFIK